jgi:Fungal potassium channel
MPCCGDRENIGSIEVHKWDNIVSDSGCFMFQVLSVRMKNLDDFHSRSCWTPLSYAILWIHLFISVATYAADIFTAINLAVFSTWDEDLINEGLPPPAVFRWLFVTCIIISFLLLAFRSLNTLRVIKSGSVVESYLDPLAIRVQSIWLGQQGRGWKRFLVYAELTKSKKGADYVALFSYFSFEGEHCVSTLRILGANCHKAWLRVVFADGPRRVVNGWNLLVVTQLNLFPINGEEFEKTGRSAITQFFFNIQALAKKDSRRTLVLFGMLFTEITWVLTALSLLLSVALYLLFLFYYIPCEDVSLKGYCRRKISTRLECIVRQKVNKELAIGLALQDRRLCQADDLGGASIEGPSSSE